MTRPTLVTTLPDPDGFPIALNGPRSAKDAAEDALRMAAKAVRMGDLRARDHWRSQATVYATLAIRDANTSR